MKLLESILLATFLLLILSRAIFSIIKPSLNLPPSPLALPIIGHLHLLGPSIHRSFHELSLLYGPLIHLRLGSVRCVVASTPELAKEFLKENELIFTARKQNFAIKRLTYDASFAFATYGPYTNFIKKLCTVELLGSRTLHHFLPLRTKQLREFIRFLMTKSTISEPVNVTEELLKLSNNTISEMMLGIRCSGTESEAGEARKLVREVTQILGEFNVSDFIWLFKYVDVGGFCKRVEDVHRRYDALLEKIITSREERRKNEKADSQNGGKDRKDLLEVLMNLLVDEKCEVKVTRDHIKALILDLFTAGTETSATFLDWALAELINNPMVLKKAQEEIDRVVGKQRLVEESDAPNLPYIQAIVKETFRLHPPLPLLNRKSTNRCTVDGCNIPANTILFVNMWSIGRNPKYWEDPLEFRPERFFAPANKCDEIRGTIDIKGHHYQLLPFGTGRKGCPGMTLAMQELPTVLAAMIQCFEWKVVVGLNGQKMDNHADMTERPGLATPRAYDLICVPHARINPVDLFLNP